MSAATLAHGIRNRERMAFAWDPVTLGLVAALLLFGLVMVTSASMSIAERDLGEPFFYLQRQFLYSCVGVGAAWALTRVPTSLWEKYSTPLLCLGLLMLLLVLIPGIGAVVNGARRWLRIGPANFQVSELARVLVLTWICAYAVRKREALQQTLGGLMTPVAPLAVAAVLLLREPDFGKQRSLMRQFEKLVLDTQAHEMFLLWRYRIVPYRSYVKGWKISPSHYVNQDLATIWLDK